MRPPEKVQETGMPKRITQHRGRTPTDAVNPLTVVTTHVNADFDALASMLAAQKLYPGALVIFPGSQEKNLRNFFIQSMVYLFNLAEIRDIDLGDVRRLILVDTRREDRIGKLAQVLENPGVEIHIFDHHPDSDGDIRGEKEAIHPTGATTTILTDLIRSKNIPITPEEATIMCLGIYEDTGSFTFSSTTSQDLDAAAFLVSKGANINVVANLISREISPEQISHLNDLIQAATHYRINGVDIVVTSIRLDHYLPDFAFLVHKMVKMEDINAIFALAQMESKIYVVARSRTDEVDVGTIVSTLGGGGHPSAAAASVKGQTLTQVEQLLFKTLHRQVRARHLARHLMSSPPITISPDISCEQANSLLTRYNINALVVSADGEPDLIGYITRQVIEKTIFHDLGHVPVKDYMMTDIAVSSPDADLLEVQEKIIGHKQRLLPVIEFGKLVGVITRTDLLNVLVQQSRLPHDNTPDPFKDPIPARTRNILNFMQERLPDRVMSSLRNLGKIAERLAFQAYVVGGFVRDLFLYRSNEDIDIVIEGDGIAFARAYAKEFGARIHSHRKFGTAVIIFDDGYKIDVATARLEYYRAPAALPDVEMSSIKMDLFRRDFTINTLAIQLNPQHFANLIDFFSSQKDIKDKAIRVLHNLSFVEDPTRVFRALRFEQRFDFTIGKLTANLIDNAVTMDFFKRLSGRRVFSEIRLILQEENPTPSIVRLNDFDLLRVIHPSISLDKERIDFLNAVKSVISWHDLLFTEQPYQRWAVYFMVLIHHCNVATSTDICAKMGLGSRYERLLCHERLRSQACLTHIELRPPKTASGLYRQLFGFKTELILYMMARTRKRTVKKAISDYYNRLRNVRLTIGGEHLIAAGLTPGPRFRQILDSTLDAKLNGKIETHQDELDFIRQFT
jgi:tRNA nucleotidyltransferase (CCA-adding enzyme)